MAKNLAAKGSIESPLIVYNRNATRANEFHDNNVNTTVATTVSEAISRADIIFICVGDDAAVQEIVEAIIATGVIQDKVFVDCSTVHPDTTTAIAERFQKHGALFVAGPVFGTPAMATAGQVISVLAGPKGAVTQVKPFTVGVIASAVIDFSDQPPTKAAQLKILGNTFILGMVESIAEGLVVAEKCGLGTDGLHQFFETIFPGAYVGVSNQMRLGDYHREEPAFAVDLARKDARHALDLASKSGTTMKSVQLTDSYLAQVKEHMGARGDMTSIYGAVRQEAGLKFEN